MRYLYICLFYMSDIEMSNTRLGLIGGGYWGTNIAINLIKLVMMIQWKRDECQSH